MDGRFEDYTLGRNIDMVKPYVAAVNFTDNPSATSRMSSLACSVIAMQHGAEPVMQIASTGSESPAKQQIHTSGPPSASAVES